MKSLEEEITRVISEKIEGGEVERLVAKSISDSIELALNNLCKSYGGVTSVIESKLKEAMLNEIEKYSFDKYVTKLDMILTEIVKNTAIDNKKILENFKNFMAPEFPSVVSVGDIFERYCNSIELDPNETTKCRFELITEDDRSYSYFNWAVLTLEDTELEECYEIRLCRMKEGTYNQWRVAHSSNIIDLKTLRRMSDFQVFLAKIEQLGTTIMIDEEEGSRTLGVGEEY